MQLALLTGDFDSFAKRRAGFFDSIELDQQLSAAQKGSHVRPLIRYLQPLSKDP